MVELDIFSGNASDAIRIDGAGAKYWRDVVSEIIEKISEHSKILINKRKRSNVAYDAKVLESCISSLGALSILAEKEDDEFDCREKIQARTVILESRNLCEKLDKYKI